MQDMLIISIKIKKTIELVRKTTSNYSHEYKFLKDNIMNTFYDLLKLTYKANIYINVIINKKSLETRLLNTIWCPLRDSNPRPTD